MSEIPALRFYGSNIAPDQVEIVNPAKIHACVESRVGGDTVSRIRLDHLHNAVPCISLQLDFTQSDVGNTPQKTIAGRIRFGVGHRLYHARRSEVDRVCPELPHHTGSDPSARVV